ncbi:ECF-type sigma factor [Roseateles sp. BYS180W]|uniref:ECF-type sigma factor n=1 Tax=Roseateles rivi TaxID=3299028 RepID=A0ABW7FQQ5_9BURK
MNDITLLLHEARDGAPGAADRVVALLYADLQRIAHARMRLSGHVTLLCTQELVNEAWLKMRGAHQGEGFNNRQHFLAYASRVMRSVVVDLVRARQAQRRGGQLQLQTFSTTLSEQLSDADMQAEVLRVHEALDELAQLDERLARVVEMRYFGGLGERDIAAALGVTERTVQRLWAKARLLLAQQLRQ